MTKKSKFSDDNPKPVISYRLYRLTDELTLDTKPFLNVFETDAGERESFVAMHLYQYRTYMPIDTCNCKLIEQPGSTCTLSDGMIQSHLKPINETDLISSF